MDTSRLLGSSSARFGAGADYPRADYPRADYLQADYPRADYPRADYPRADYPQADYEPVRTSYNKLKLYNYIIIKL